MRQRNENKWSLRLLVATCAAVAVFGTARATESDVGAGKRFPYKWVFNSYGIKTERHWIDFSNMVERAAALGYNGICSQREFEDAVLGRSAYARAFYEKAIALCERLHLQLIPYLTGQGYPGSACFADPESIEATELRDLVYVSDGEKAVFEPQDTPEPYDVAAFGKRIAQATLRPYRYYRLGFYLKTENMYPDVLNKFRISCHYPETKESQFFDPWIRPTADWTYFHMDFNTYESGKISINGQKFRKDVSGRYFVRDVVLRERGPVHMMTSDGMAPVVRDASTGVIYEPGRDYEPIAKMTRFTDLRYDPEISFRLPKGSRIVKGMRLSVNCWVPAVVGNRWNAERHQSYSGCPSARQVYEHAEKLIAATDDFLHRPASWFLGADEWRVANRCKRCRVRNVDPGALMGEYVASIHKLIRRQNPSAEVIVCQDMFCPYDNAKPHYYCVRGDLTRSWNHLPKDIIVLIWKNRPEPKSFRHFSENGFRTMLSGYYDKPDVSDDREWIEEAVRTPGCIGVQYTSYLQKYDLLGAYSDLIDECIRDAK